MSNENGLPEEWSRQYGPPANTPNVKGDNPMKGMSAPGSGSGSGSGSVGGGNARQKKIRYTSNYIRTTLQPGESFQVMPDNPKRVYLAITSISGITLAFGRAISSSDVQREYSIQAGESIFFDTGTAPTGSVNTGTIDPNSPALMTVSILEGIAYD